MSSFEAAISQLPPPILNKLDAMIRRVRRLLFVRGLFATMAVALTCLLVIMAIDATITLFSSTARWALSLTGLMVTLGAAWWFLLRPLSRKLTLTHMARILEIRHPELQERISTAVELLSSEDPDSIKGSEELIEAVVDSAVVDVEAVDPKTEFAPVKTKRFAKIAAVAAGIVLLLLAIWPNQAWTLLTRAIAPFLDIGNAYADSMVVEPGDIRIARGENLTVELGIHHTKLKRAEIRKRLPDGSETVERMTLIDDIEGQKTFSLTFPNVQESFTYRVRAGSAVSEFFDVEVVDPPSIESLTIRYDYPEYTGKPDLETVTETGEIRAVARTRVTVTATTNTPLWTARMIINEASEVEAPNVEEYSATWEFEMIAGMNGTWNLELGDKDGFTNMSNPYPLEVLPDKPPTVQISQPVLRELNLKPTERLPIMSEIVEDFGVASVALLVTPDGAPTPISVAKELPAAGARTDEYRSNVTLDIAALGLKPEQRRLAVQVQVKDGRPADYDGPGIGLSEVIFINLDRNAKSLADQAIEAQRRELNEKMQKAEQELKRAKSEIERAERELKKDDEINDSATSALDQFSERAESARDALDEMAAALDTPLFRDQSQQAQKIADEPVAEAMEKADLIPVTDDKNQRVAEARDARNGIDEALKSLDELEKSMKEADSVYDMISELNDLANRQQEVAQKAQEWSEKAEQQAAEMARKNSDEAQRQFDQQQKREQQQFQAEQNRVENQLGEMLKDNAAALAEVLEQQREEAMQMAEQAQALADEQEALREINREASKSNSKGEEVLKEQLLDHLQKKQEQLAAKAAQKAEAAPSNPQAEQQKAKSNTPDAEPEQESLAQAANQAKKAADELAKRELEPASKAANEASDSFSEAAQSEVGESMNETEKAEAGEQVADTSEQTAATDSEAPAPEEDPQMADSGESGEGAPEDNSNAETSDLPSSHSLAETQMALARQIEAIKNGNLQEALASMEEQLAQEADALQADARAMETTMQNLDQNSAQRATDQAERALDQGAQKADDSGRQLAQAQQQQNTAEERGDVSPGELAPPAQSTMERAQAAQQQSQSLLEQAADALARSSEEIGQTLEGLEPSDMDDRITNSEDLAEGFEEVSNSAQSQNAKQAAEQSQQAADSLQQLARAAMQKMGNQNQNQQQPLPPQDNPDAPESENLNETGEKTSDADGSGVPPELSSLGISIEDWTRFKGALIGGNATAIETELPAEYRELVGRYFQVIAKEAGKEE